ncbi:hypothetical protein C8F04DRAFT_891655, partial [Mycena alexandri]
AFIDSANLLREGKSSWASDLIIILRRLPEPIEVGPDNLLLMDSVNAIEKRIVQIVDTDLQRDINHLVKTHLLRNRLEMGKDRSLALAPRRLRHYLTVVAAPAHCNALTGILLSDHLLSIERLRYSTRYRDPVPRNFRLCRLCWGSVKDEVHALFDCTTEQHL